MANDPTDEMPLRRFIAVSGDAVVIKAVDEKDAQERYAAWLEGDKCPCTAKNCDCVTDYDCITHIEYFDDEGEDV